MISRAMPHNEKPHHASTWQGSKSQTLGQGLHPKISAVRLDPLPLSSSRKRPPFGVEVERALMEGRQPNVFCFADADAWERAGRRRESYGPGSALVVPKNADPAALRWPAGLDACCAVACTLSRADAVRLALSMVSGGVRCVVILGQAEPIFVRRSAGSAAA